MGFLNSNTIDFFSNDKGYIWKTLFILGWHITKLTGYAKNI